MTFSREQCASRFFERETIGELIDIYHCPSNRRSLSIRPQRHDSFAMAISDFSDFWISFPPLATHTGII
jgi:hypothetical protein